MNTCVVSDFEKVCRICMKFDKTFLSITSFKIIDMIIECASVQIWENDDLPNQICQSCFLQLQNTVSFKKLCQNSDNTFRQIIKQNKINLSNNQNNLDNVKDEEFDDYTDDTTFIDIKEEDIHENIKNENTLENVTIKIANNENDSDKFETNKCKPELNKIQIEAKSEEENDICEDIQDDEDVTETFNCDKCNKEFKKAWILSKHMHLEHRAKPLKCDKCKLKSYHPIHLKKHKELMHNPLNLTCTKCNKVVKNIYKLKYHKCKRNSLKLLQCPRCDKSFEDKRDLKCHIKEAHKRTELYVACHICGKSVLKKNIKIHLVIHNEREKIKCEICSKTFLLQLSLSNHIKYVHENQQPARNHLCNICGHAARSTSDLRMHLTSHSNERPYACDQCDKTYKIADNLRDHVRRVHLNQRKHQCRFCPQAFHERRILVNHERRHTGEKPHKCEVCDKRFIQKVALRVHMKTHTNTSENFIQS